MDINPRWYCQCSLAYLLLWDIYANKIICFGERRKYISKLKMIFKIIILGITDIW